jgi:hypothetical protein
LSSCPKASEERERARADQGASGPGLELTSGAVDKIFESEEDILKQPDGINIRPIMCGGIRIRTQAVANVECYEGGVTDFSSPLECNCGAVAQSVNQAA